MLSFEQSFATGSFLLFGAVGTLWWLFTRFPVEEWSELGLQGILRLAGHVNFALFLLMLGWWLVSSSFLR